MLDELRSLSREFIQIRHRNYRRYFIKTVTLDHRFAIILGDRGVGKTTTLIQYLLQSVAGDQLSNDILYIQSDHILLGSITLYEIAEQFYKLGGQFIAFDEIHKYLNWSVELKSIFDTFPDLKILASGSSALEIHKGTHDLSRRAIVYKMWGLSFREYLEIKYDMHFASYPLADVLHKHESIARDVIKKSDEGPEKILQWFQQYLRYGYYPYFLEYNTPESFHLTLEQNMHTTIEADLVSIYPNLTGYSLKKIMQLLSYIARTVPFTPNWSTIKEIVHVKDHRTVHTYFKYLEDAGLICTLTKGNKKLSSIQAIEKVYLGNTNQFFALERENISQGTIREIFFLSMLNPHHNVYAPKQGDFQVDDKYIVEVGGKKKNFNQIKSLNNAYLALDNIEVGIDKKIPLWLFGFLY